MDIFRRALRLIVRNLAEKDIISLKTTALINHTIETLRMPRISGAEDLNEKIMHYAFFGDTALWPKLSDKFEVREFVAEKGFSETLIPLIGIYDSPEEIDFDKLPANFVIKATGGTARTIIVRNKSSIPIKKVKSQINHWMRHQFGKATGEAHYLEIKPRIVIEELLDPSSKHMPLDYKFMCFNGYVHSCLVCSNRNEKTFISKRNLMNVRNWEEIPESVVAKYKGDASSLKKPQGLDEMIDIASTLSKGFPFVRVDLYDINGKVFFGELTFTPSAFHITSITRKILIEMGKLM